jgi:hypothetical protein
MEVVVLLPMFIVMTKSNAVLQLKLFPDWCMTFVVQVGIHAWSSFGINNISCCLIILIHAFKISDENENANVVCFCDK